MMYIYALIFCVHGQCGHTYQTQIYDTPEACLRAKEFFNKGEPDPENWGFRCFKRPVSTWSPMQ